MITPYFGGLQQKTAIFKVRKKTKHFVLNIDTRATATAKTDIQNDVIIGME